MKTKHDLELLHNFIELIPDLVFVKNLEGKYTHCNEIFLKFINKKREEVISKTDYDLFTKKNADMFRAVDNKVYKTKTNKVYNEEQLMYDDNSVSYLNTSKQILYNLDDKKVGLFCVATDITIKKEYEIIYTDNKNLLEYIAIENNLKTILNKIIHLAEKRNENTKCSILLLDKEKKYFLLGAAPSLPSFYNDAINGLKIGKNVGSCGSAAFRKERVIVENINTDHKWEGFTELTEKANIHSCWSQPIISSNNEILGTFAIYNNRPKKPSSFELKLIFAYSNLAAIAIEKDENYKIILENEYQLSVLFNNTQSGLIYVNSNRNIIKANQRSADIFGYNHVDELVGINTLKFYSSKEEYKKLGIESSLVLKNQETFNIEYQFKKKDGTIIWCELSGKALKKSFSTKIEEGILWTVNDITKRKEALEKVENLNKLAHSLSESQATLLSLFDKGDAVLFKWKNNSTYDVEYVSSSVTKLFGYSKDDFLLSNIKYMDCIHKDDLTNVLKEVTNACENKLTYFNHEPYRIISKNGSIKWVLDYTVLQKDSDDNVTHFIGYTSDITEQLKQQEIMFQQSKMASMGEMIGNISHQWRQPLSIISSISTASKLEKELDILDNERFMKNMDIINTNAQYLSQTIDDFREFIKADRQLNDFNLTNTLKSFLNVASSSITKNNIHIILDLENEIIMKNYQNDMIQAFMNIINNSIDALIEKQQKQRYFFISTKKDKDKIIIKLKDNAGGISTDILAKVFEPYTTTKHKSLGTGLGLNITYNFIVVGMKGKISVENTTYIYEDCEYTGCEFTIVFNQ